MKIPKNYDVVSNCPDGNKGTLPWDNPGIAPRTTPVPETPGEKVSNDPTQFEMNKGQPFGKGGSGYTKSS